MTGAVIAITFIAGIIGFIALVIFEEEGCFPICIIGAIAAFLIYYNWETPEEKQKRVDEGAAIVAKNCPNEYDIIEGVPQCRKKEEPVEVDVSVPDEETPKEKPKEEPKTDLDFDKFAQDNVETASAACDRDGNSVYVAAWLYTDGEQKGKPTTFTIWPRLDENGKPIRCNNGKAPKEAPPQKDVQY